MKISDCQTDKIGLGMVFVYLLAVNVLYYLLMGTGFLQKLMSD